MSEAGPRSEPRCLGLCRSVPAGTGTGSATRTGTAARRAGSPERNAALTWRAARGRGRPGSGTRPGAAPRPPVSDCSVRPRAALSGRLSPSSQRPLPRAPPLLVYWRSPSGAPRGADGAAAAGGRCRRCCPLRLGGASGGGRGAAAGGGQDLNEGR